MTVTVRNKTPLTVPDRVRRRAGFKPGDKVEFRVPGGMVTILPKVPLTHDSDDTLTPAEAREVRHALKQVRDGKTAPWAQVKDELGL